MAASAKPVHELYELVDSWFLVMLVCRKGCKNSEESGGKLKTCMILGAVESRFGTHCNGEITQSVLKGLH